jgi:hypothetical protein
MKRSLLAVVVVSVLLTSAGWCKSAPRPSEKELSEITARGILLAEYDQVAWRATDAVQAAHPQDGKVKNYIARKTATGWAVDFGKLNDTGDKFLVAYEAVQKNAPGNFEVSKFDPERPDTGFDLAAVRGVNLALKDLGNANRPYNVAVLPAESGDLFVYLYPAQVTSGVYPYGGDVRYLVTSDGTTIITKRQMHKAVLEYNPGNMPGGTTAAAGYHTHILTELPEDSDVLLVLTRQPRVPEFIAAGGHIYEISVDGKIKIDK